MSVQFNSGMPTMPMPGSSQQSQNTLSTEQKNTIESVLSEFDPSSLTEQDAKEIVEAFEEAGIRPGADLENTLSSLGYDARELGDLAGVEPPGDRGADAPPPPPPSSESSGLNQENLQALQSILEQYTDIENLSADEQQQLTDLLLEAGLLEPGALIDTTS